VLLNRHCSFGGSRAPPIQSAAHKTRAKRQNKAASSTLSPNTEATAAAAQTKSAAKRSTSRTAPLLDGCISRFRPARNDFLRTF
jgi:hypothetical protein